MKKIFLALGLAAFMAGQTQTAKAHGGFGIAAGVIGGLAAGVTIGAAIAQPPPAYYYAPAPAYYAAPPATYTYQTPAPVVVYQQPAVVYAQPAYVVPAPAVTFSFGYYPRYSGSYGYRTHFYYRGRR